MGNVDRRKAIEEARQGVAELERMLAAAATRAVEIGAIKTLERLDAATVAAARAERCLDRLDETLSEEEPKEQVTVG